jgi:two-component system, chemotaxis family, chemotaxis protein CheY
MAKKILVVDDSRTVRHLLEAVLAEAGYEVLQASNGLEGVEVISTTRDISLVICDLNMPTMSGIDMLQVVKQEPRNADLIVLMLTTEDQPAMMARAKAAGAKGWIVKPFKPDLLLATVRKLAGAPTTVGLGR